MFLDDYGGVQNLEGTNMGLTMILGSASLDMNLSQLD